MDPIKLEKFEAMSSYNKAISKSSSSNNNNALVYILTALTCSMVFFTPFWYPSFESLISSIPKLISHLLASPKCLFIVCNFIVFYLVGESNLLTAKSPQQASGEVYYHEYLSRSNKPLIVPVTSDHNVVIHVVVHKESKKVSEVARSGGRSRPVITSDHNVGIHNAVVHRKECKKVKEVARSGSGRLRPVTSDHDVGIHDIVVHKECKKASEVARSGSGRIRPIIRVETIQGNKDDWGTKGSVESTYSAEELSKRADDFIARVNRQRMLEAADLVGRDM